MMLNSASAALRDAAAALLGSAGPYNPDDPSDRMELAAQLKKRLEAAGFKLDPGRNGEDVYVFQHRKDPGLHIKIYTSIYRGATRAKAKDAIRVVMLYQQQRNAEKKVIPMGKMPIVKRSTKSTIETIVERVVDRAREAYKTVNSVDRCKKCSAPMATSKAGKPYCAEVCWLDKGAAHKHSHSHSVSKAAVLNIPEMMPKKGASVKVSHPGYMSEFKGKKVKVLKANPLKAPRKEGPVTIIGFLELDLGDEGEWSGWIDHKGQVGLHEPL